MNLAKVSKQAAGSGRPQGSFPANQGASQYQGGASAIMGFGMQQPGPRSCCYTKDKQQFVVSVVAYESLPGHQSYDILRFSTIFGEGRLNLAIERKLSKGTGDIQ